MESLPSPALLMYLFSDSFVPSANGPLTQYAFAPRTGERLDLKKLVTRLYSAVFQELAYSDALRLFPAEIKKFLGAETALLAEPRSARVAFSTNSLAGQVLGRLTPGGKPDDSRVRELVIRQVGGRDSTATPWLDALAPFITDAVRCGFVAMPEKKPPLLSRLFNPADTRTRVIPLLERIDPLRTAAIEANGRLDQFLAFQGEAGEMLLREIESGINACQRHSD